MASVRELAYEAPSQYPDNIGGGGGWEKGARVKISKGEQRGFSLMYAKHKLRFPRDRKCQKARVRVSKGEKRENAISVRQTLTNEHLVPVIEEGVNIGRI